LIDKVVADGVVTARKRAVPHRKAAALGFDADEGDMFVDASKPASILSRD
jgi:hypothetical protein